MEDISRAVVQLLNQFENIFDINIGIPKSRIHDHAIRLLPVSKPPQIRPYRYPFHQKNVIEKIVGEMLLAGIIRPSSNPIQVLCYWFARKMEAGGSTLIIGL